MGQAACRRLHAVVVTLTDILCPEATRDWSRKGWAFAFRLTPPQAERAPTLGERARRLYSPKACVCTKHLPCRRHLHARAGDQRLRCPHRGRERLIFDTTKAEHAVALRLTAAVVLGHGARKFAVVAAIAIAHDPIDTYNARALVPDRSSALANQ